MQNKHFTIKTMTKMEVELMIDWAAAEGWNPGLNDAECYFPADPEGFLVGFLGDEPIATISAINYHDAFGFIGFYIVKPDYRGKGYGIQIWNAALKRLKGLNIGLDGVVEQQENYKKSGFNLAYRNIRFAGVGGGNSQQNSDIVDLATVPFEIIDAYEQAFFPVNRANFTKVWLSQPQCDAFGVMQNGELAGYGVIRKCQNGFKIGPLFADSPQLAESLFLALKSKASASDAIFLDTPEINQAAVALAQKYNMQVSFETARMYTNDSPSLPLNRIFGVTSFEIG
ncbi:GNAT family N-acetyltransferase [Pseudoalteromonas shioyasakiensis]|uniref:GNAT family N-acetyltransferase n=1 Tax=Pseudoalteromonas shioyasakiensis TaxID=1190813 RepID=UPI0022B106C5|nr:GNAT family N-acetyltransferase [Pseudoalteromonas shioyasakiensis]MCZ4251131.1 GNAT family N-acetyltransferase [Pseudoalteromonas shioyasakiensis]